MVEELNYLLLKNSVLSKKALSRKLQDINVTYPQWCVMKTIRLKGRVTAKEISNNTNIDKATLSDILNRLEKNKMVIRKPSIKDKRYLDIELTKEAMSMCDQVKRIEASFIKEVFSGFNDEELKQFKVMVRKLNKNLGDD